MKGSSHTKVAASVSKRNEHPAQHPRTELNSGTFLQTPSCSCFLRADTEERERTWARLRPTLWVTASISDKPAGCNDSQSTLSRTKIRTFYPPLALIVVYRRTNSSTRLQRDICRCHVFVSVHNAKRFDFAHLSVCWFNHIIQRDSFICSHIHPSMYESISDILRQRWTKFLTRVHQWALEFQWPHWK